MSSDEFDLVLKEMDLLSKDGSIERLSSIDEEERRSQTFDPQDAQEFLDQCISQITAEEIASVQQGGSKQNKPHYLNSQFSTLNYLEIENYDLPKEHKNKHNLQKQYSTQVNQSPAENIIGATPNSVQRQIDDLMNVTISINHDEILKETIGNVDQETNGALDETRVTPYPYFENKELMQRVKPMVKQNLKKMMSMKVSECESMTELENRSEDLQMDEISVAEIEDNTTKKQQRINKFKFMLQASIEQAIVDVFKGKNNKE